ncbi:MAG: mechanosensitive ion channel family protein, partial [Cyanobacteria bacterium J06638_28]
MNWRAVRLQTIEGNVVIIPNGALGKQTILNYNLPNTARGIWIEVGFSYNDPPNKVKRILRQVLTEVKGVDLDKGFKIVSTGNYDDFFINYRVMFMAANYISAFKARNDFRTRLYYVAKRNGLTIPFPISHIYHTSLEQNAIEDSPQEIVDYLQSLPYFAEVEVSALETLALNAEIEYYGTGEQVLRQNELAPGLYIIQRGSATLTFKDNQGVQQSVAEVSQGDFFGESVLMSGKTSAVSAVADNDLKVIRLEPAATASLFTERPLFAKQLDGPIDERRKIIRRLREKGKVELVESAASNSLPNGSSALHPSSK